MMIFGNRRKSEDEATPTDDRMPNVVPATQPTAPERVGFETVLGATSVMEGSLRCAGNIRLDGQFSGMLQINGNVLVGETAMIEADINGDNISIAGTVRGNVMGKRLQLLRTARVFGDITATAFSSDEGALIEGKVVIREEETPPEDEAQTLPDESPPDVVDSLVMNDDDTTAVEAPNINEKHIDTQQEADDD